MNMKMMVVVMVMMVMTFSTVSEFIFIIIIFSSEIMKYFSGVDDPFVGNTTLHNGGFNIVQTKVKL